MTRYFLAIDSGGTKCDALLVGSDGTAIGWGHCNVNDPDSGRGVGGSGRSMQSVSRAVQQSLEDVTCDEFQVVTWIKHLSERVVETLVPGRIELHKIGEGDAVFALAGCNCGIVVLAGTGAFVFGSTRDGRSLWLDGLGPLLGDYGSGYHIGLLGVRAAARSSWHPRHETSLAVVVPSACKAYQPGQSNFNLVRYMLESRDRAEIASLAKLVNAEANAGDSVSRQILEEAASAIAETLRDVVDRLKMAEEDYPMIGAGSVASGSKIYWEQLCGLAAQFAPRLTPMLVNAPLAAGMILAVSDRIGVDDPEAFRQNLLRSAKELMEGKNDSAQIP